MNQAKFLPHLEKSIPDNVFSRTLSLYSIALEGWRRGLTLRFENENKPKAQTSYYLSDGHKEHRFEISRGDSVGREAIRVCLNKERTKEHLVKANVPTPKGQVFHNKANEEIRSFAQKLGYPVTIKLMDASPGYGLTESVRNNQELEKRLIYFKDKLGYNKFMVEEYFEGIDCYAIIVDSKVIGVIKRIPAYVIGDGELSVRTLIKNKEKERFKNPALFGRKIAIDKELYNMLERQGYTLDSVPELNETVVLKSKNNVTSGGESIDITDEISDEIKQIAIDAAKAIPGLVQCGVDLMVNMENQTATVIEINSRPHITAQLFPTKGKARNIPKAIIDYYFPETKADYNAPLAYFDYEHVWQAFQRGLSHEITIPDLPKGKLIARSFHVSNIKESTYQNWVRRNVRRLNLSGHIMHFRSEKSYFIAVLGSEKMIDKFRELIKNPSRKSYRPREINEQPYSDPIQIGFKSVDAKRKSEYSQGYSPVQIKGLRKDLLLPSVRRNSKSKKSSVKKVNHVNDYKKEYEKIIDSTSWKVTKPLRFAGQLFKKKDK